MEVSNPDEDRAELANKLLCIHTAMASTFARVRHPAIKHLYELIATREDQISKYFNVETEAHHIPIDTYIVSCLKCIETHVNDIRDAKTATSRTTCINRNSNYVKIIDTLIEIAYQNKLVRVPVQEILVIIIQQLQNMEIVKYIGNTYMQIVERCISKYENFTSAILLNEWNGLLECSFALWDKKSENDLNATIILNLINTIVKTGPLYVPIIKQFTKYFEGLQRMASTLERGRNFHTLLSIIYNVCLEVGMDYTNTMSDFLSDCLDSMIKQFDFYAEAATKELFFRPIRFYMMLRKGYLDLERDLTDLFEMICQEIKAEAQLPENKETMSKNLIEIASIVVEETILKRDHDADVEVVDDGDPPVPKRVKINTKIEMLIERIRLPNNSLCWRWFAIMTEYLYQYPFDVEKSDVYLFYDLLKEYHRIILYSIEVESFQRFCYALIQQEDRLKVQNHQFWERLSHSAFQHAATSPTISNDYKEFLTFLVSSKIPFSDQLVRSIIETFTHDIKIKDKATAVLLRTMFLHINITNLPDSKELVEQIIKWAIPIDSNHNPDTILFKKLIEITDFAKLIAQVLVMYKDDNQVERPPRTKRSPTLTPNNSHESLQYKLAFKINLQLLPRQEWYDSEEVDVDDTCNTLYEPYAEYLAKLLKEEYADVANQPISVGVVQLAVFVNIFSEIIILRCLNSEQISRYFLLKLIRLKMDLLEAGFSVPSSETNIRPKEFNDILLALQFMFNSEHHRLVGKYLRECNISNTLEYMERYVSRVSVLKEYKQDCELEDTITANVVKFLALYIQQPVGPNFDKVFDYLDRALGDLNASNPTQLELIKEVVVTILDGRSSTPDTADLVLDSIKVICVRHYLNIDDSNFVLDVLPDLIKYAEPHNLVYDQLITSLINLANSKKYGVPRITKILYCLKCFFKATDRLFETNVNINEFLDFTEMVNLRSIQLHYATFDCLSEVFLKAEKQDIISDYSVTLFIFTQDLYHDLFIENVPMNEDDIHNIDCCSYQLYGLISTRSEMMRGLALFSLFEYMYKRNMNTERSYRRMCLICHELNVSIDELFTTYIDQILYEWYDKNYSFFNFPFIAVECNSIVELCKKYRDSIAFWSLTYGPDEVQKLSDTIGCTVALTLKRIHPRVIAYILPVLAKCRNLPAKYGRVVTKIQQMINHYNIDINIRSEQSVEIVDWLCSNLYDPENFFDTYGIKILLPGASDGILKSHLAQCVEYIHQKIDRCVIRNIRQSIDMLNRAKTRLRDTPFNIALLNRFYQYSFAFVYVVECLIFQGFDEETFFYAFRDASYFLCKSIIAAETSEIKFVCATNLKLACAAILSHLNFNISKKQLHFTVSSLVPCCTENNPSRLSKVALYVLNELLVVHGSRFANQMIIVDDFPEDSVFDTMRTTLSRIKRLGSMGKIILGREIQYFLKIDKRNVTGLNALKLNLATKKDQVEELLMRLQSNVYSDPCELEDDMANGKRLMITLISKLLQYVQSSEDMDVAIEAAKCLGEIGASDLRTMTVEKEDHWNKYIRFREIDKLASMIYGVTFNCIDSFLLDYDMKKQNIATETCSMLSRMVDGCPEISSHLILKIFVPRRPRLDIPYLMKDVSNITPFNFKIMSEANVAATHDEWTIHFVTKILKHFGDRVLIKLVALDAKYAEQLLPFLVATIMMGNVRLYKSLGVMVNKFFEEHNNPLGNNITPTTIYYNRAIVKTMLQIVECIRVINTTVTKNRADWLNLNYLNIAKAAEFCGSHFHVILYCEYHNNSLKTEHNSATTTNIYKLMKNAYISLDKNQEAAVFVDPENIDSDMILFESDHKNHNLGILLSTSTTIPSDNAQCQGLYVDMMLNKGLLELASEEILLKYDKTYECAWRMGQWESIKEVPIETPLQLFEKKHYTALKFLKEKDRVGVEDTILEARNAVVEILRNTSVGIPHNIYKHIVKLQMLQQVEDFAKIQFSPSANEAKSLFDKWEAQDQFPSNDFKYRELILSHRITLLSLAGLRAKRSFSYNEVQSNCILKLANECIESGYYEKAHQQVLHLKSLESAPTISDKINLMAAKVNMKLNKMNLAKTNLRAIKQSQSFEMVEAYIMYGDISSECSLENSEYYYMKAKDMLQKLMNDDGEAVDSQQSQLMKIYMSIATFADRQFTQTNALKKTDEFKKKADNVEKYKKSASALKKKSRATRDERQMYITMEKSAKNDEHEIRTVNESYGKYMQMALDYYLKLNIGADDVTTTLFRILFLWFIDEYGAMDLLRTNWTNIPSWKFLTIIPQIAARLGTVTNESNTLILEILEKCATDHPHHVLPHIFALKCAHMDDPDNQPANVELRVTLASQLIDKLKNNSALTACIDQMEGFWIKLIELANKIGEHIASPIDTVFQLKTLKYVQCPTIELPVSQNGTYNTLIYINRFEQSFESVGGINAPKKIAFQCSDGQLHSALVKGRDDLRQDAVMQQVFRMMNILFLKNKETNRDNLNIRTYKVTPLSQRSGILEWCLNTCPLSEYLIGNVKVQGAHKRFRPMDMTPTQCREAMTNNKTKPTEVKLKLYKEMIKKIWPVFHNFFLENFEHPWSWFESRMAYTKSVATTSMVGFILGIGDRHLSNILIDKKTAEVVHIDFGIAFEQGKCLPTTETVPFRLTRDIVDGFGVTGERGLFRKSCIDTLQVLRDNKTTITSILELLLYDPLYSWTLTNQMANARQDIDVDDDDGEETEDSKNITAERALLRVIAKLEGRQEGIAGVLSTENQVEWLIAQATSVMNLYRLFEGWQPYL